MRKADSSGGMSFGFSRSIGVMSGLVGGIVVVADCRTGGDGTAAAAGGTVAWSWLTGGIPEDAVSTAIPTRSDSTAAARAGADAAAFNSIASTSLRVGAMATTGKMTVKCGCLFGV